MIYLDPANITTSLLNKALSLPNVILSPHKYDLFYTEHDPGLFSTEYDLSPPQNDPVST
jgi:hypothetical protein